MRSVFYPSRTQSGTNAASLGKRREGTGTSRQAEPPAAIQKARKNANNYTCGTDRGNERRRESATGGPFRRARQAQHGNPGRSRTDTRQETGRIPDRAGAAVKPAIGTAHTGKKRRLRNTPQPSYLSGISRSNKAGRRWPRPYTSIYARLRLKRPTR